MSTKYDLARLARVNARKLIVFRAIFTTRAQAIDLATILLATVNQIESRLPRFVEIYTRTLEQKLRHDSVDELGGELDDMDRTLQRLVLEMDPSLRRWAFRTEGWHRGKWKRAVLDAVNVELTTMLSNDVQDTIETWLKRNTALVRNVSDEARGRIADAVFRGYTNRATAREIAKEIRNATDLARKRSIRIAGDQVVKLSSALTAERRRQAGLKLWKWRHSGKPHFRPEHLARDGQIYSDETAPKDLPGQLPYCGCVEQAVLDLS